MNAQRIMHALNGILWAVDAVVSAVHAHSAPLAAIGVIGLALAAVLLWLEP